MRLPSNTWCKGSNLIHTEGAVDHCPVCDLQFFSKHRVVPKHRPRFDKKEEKDESS